MLNQYVLLLDPCSIRQTRPNTLVSRPAFGPLLVKMCSQRFGKRDSRGLGEIIDVALSGTELPLSSVQTEKEKVGGLTVREREVAALIAQGKSNREIAKSMTVGVKTVETYVTRILNKLGLDLPCRLPSGRLKKG